MRCDCGAAFEPTILPELDFTRFAGGLPSTAVDVHGLRCSSCGATTLDGVVIDRLLRLLAREVSLAPEPLEPVALKFLRKRLGKTQDALAQALGINRVTVADWERGAEPISGANVTRLRSLVWADELRQMALDMRTDRKDTLAARIERVAKMFDRLSTSLERRSDHGKHQPSSSPFVVTDAA